MNQETELFITQQEESMRATSILSLFETTKSQRASFAREVIEKMQDAQVEPLKVHLQIKAMENIIEIFTDRKKYPETAKDYQGLILDAAEKYGKKFSYQNAEFSIKEVGSSYDFSQCGDPIIASLLAQQELIKKQVDARKEFLKTVPSSGLDIRVDDELVTVYPPAKSSTTSVAVSLK